MPEQDTVAVFGAYGLIGAACARAFDRAGWTVHLVGRDRAKLDRLAAELSEGTTVAVADIGSAQDARDVLSPHAGYGAILTPIGGPAPTGPIAEATPNDVTEAMRAKLLSQWVAAGASRDVLASDGALMLFSGLLARLSFPGMNAMGTVNAAVERLARSLDDEWDGVRVRCISPGMVKPDADASQGEVTPDAVAALALDLASSSDGGNAASSGAVVRDIPEGLA